MIEDHIIRVGDDAVDIRGWSSPQMLGEEMRVCDIYRLTHFRLFVVDEVLWLQVDPEASGANLFYY